ncbi:AAA family ATPase [Flavobacterium bizetiae]|uniref:AAA family ATPase n=1 Tax=Flavobacterium bizetiae TaxID=2704140 RepID=UPI0021E8891A|nr:AAA family ATPase [Flavobacterium bizetiae]UTN05492.1 AAA family ATPase [Flavobacterium bizetiae]
MITDKPYLKEISLKRDLIESYEQYPFTIPSIKGLDKVEFHPDVTFIVGENGSGKSTLIEAIALNMGLGQEGGSKHARFSTHQNISGLFNYLKIVKSYSLPKDYYFLRAESFYNLATYMEETDNLQGTGHSLHECSHGESFMKILTERLGGNGLYIFDEPEAALSPMRQLTMFTAIDEHVKNNSQFIIATHSPILLAYPNAIIYQLDEKGIRQIDYEETEHYLVTKGFLNNYKNMTEILLDHNK